LKVKGLKEAPLSMIMTPYCVTHAFYGKDDTNFRHNFHWWMGTWHLESLWGNNAFLLYFFFFKHTLGKQIPYKESLRQRATSVFWWLSNLHV